jgi:hypothetical protein
MTTRIMPIHSQGIRLKQALRLSSRKDKQPERKDIPAEALPRFRLSGFPSVRILYQTTP